MKQSGLFYKWRMKWWPRQTFCTRSDVTESKPVTIKDMQVNNTVTMTSFDHFPNKI